MREYRCQECGYSCRNAGYFARHLKDQHGLPYSPTQCNKCDATLTDSNWPGYYRRRRVFTCTSCKAARASRNDKARKSRIKKATMDAFGGKCACCGEDDYRFLTVDHIHNDGAAHRKELGISFGYEFYKWLEREGYPKDRFQCLCWNCNHGKFAYGSCPHQLNSNSRE